MMIVHRHAISRSVVVTLPRRALPMAAFFNFTCILDEEVYKVENKDNSSVLNANEIGMK